MATLWTCLLRLPKSTDAQQERDAEEVLEMEANVESVEEDSVEANYPT